MRTVRDVEQGLADVGIGEYSIARPQMDSGVS
jgi:hypothetical protein